MTGALLSFCVMAVSIRGLWGPLTIMEILALRALLGLAIIGAVATVRPALRHSITMRRLPLHVVRNGVRFTPIGQSVDIALRIRRDRGEEQAEICVRDYGTGVADHLLPRLFEPFYRLPDSSGATGAGLGLAITHRAVQIHGGTVAATNAVDGGLAVTMAVPVSAMMRALAMPSMPRKASAAS